MFVGAALRPLVHAHATSVPEIAARLARAGLDAAAAPDALERLPLLRKSTLAALQAEHPPYGGLLATGCVPTSAFLSSSGVVEPLVPRMVERLAELLREAGFASGQIVLNGFGYHVTPAGMLFHEALASAGCTVLPGGPQNASMLGDYARRLGATAFVGIASHLRILLEQAPGLAIRLAMAGAEPHGDAIRAELSARHGVRCVDMYGFAEAGVIAATCAPAGALHLHADVVAEVLESEGDAAVGAGEPGELVVSLDNPGFPLLRFATGDLVAIDPVRCACGRSGILRVLGRVDQSVRVKGMLLHASQLRRFADAIGATACRLAVTRLDGRDRIGVTILPGDAPIADAASLDAAFRDACRLRADAIGADASLAAGSFTVDDRRQS